MDGAAVCNLYALFLAFCVLANLIARLEGFSNLLD